MRVINDVTCQYFLFMIDYYVLSLIIISLFVGLYVLSSLRFSSSFFNKPYTYITVLQFFFPCSSINFYHFLRSLSFYSDVSSINHFFCAINITVVVNKATNQYQQCYNFCCKFYFIFSTILQLL